jgi:Condensation domain
MNAVQSPTKPIADLYPLAPMQQGMLFHSLLSPEAGIYLPQVDLSLAGDLDAIALKQAWQTVIAQHPVLRTGFQWEKHEQPFQVVYHQAELPWQELDWRNLPADPQRLDRFLASDRQRGFDLKKPPLMRLTLIRTSDTQYHLIWTQHHLILDGWSAGLVLSDVFQTYQGEALPSRRPYRDYIAWRQQRSQTDPKNESKKESQIETFWRTQMQGFTAPTLLPIRQADPPSEETQPDWAEQCLSLTGDQTQALQSFAKQHQLTLNTVVQGAFAILLSRYTDQTDVCFGATISGRPATLSGADAMIGLFINTIPVRLQVPGDRPLVPWLQALQTQQLEAMQQDCSLLDLQAWCDLPPGTPLFESIVVFENYPIDASLLQLNQAQSSQTSDRPIQITQVRPIEWTSLPMTLLVSSSDRLTFQLKFHNSRQCLSR